MRRVVLVLLVLVMLGSVTSPATAKNTGELNGIKQYLYNRLPKKGLPGYEIIPRGGISEAGISERELVNLIESARIENFMDPTTGRIDDGKLKNFKNPVEVIVEKLRMRGYSDEKIVRILEKYNMFYDPKTGATAIGIKLPPDLESRLPTRSFQTEVESCSPCSAQQRTEYPLYRGINTNIMPGSMAINQSGTFQHVVTTHVGREYRGSNYWVEVGVFRDLGFPDWWLFTYDNDEGQWMWHGVITGEQNQFKNYIIYVYDNRDNNGYNYGVWIEGDWVRGGHLPWLENYVDEAKEVWSNTGVVTSDTQKAVFRDPFLYYQDRAIWWNEEVSTTWWPVEKNYPVKENHYIGGYSWTFEAWVE